MKSKSGLLQILTAGTLLAGSASVSYAGITVDPAKIVSGAAYGTLFAIDVPTTSVFPTTGGPDWTTLPPAGVTAVTADNGFVALPSYGIREAYGDSPWEPDGTVFGTAKTYGTYSTGNPNCTYNFNLADAGVNLPDGAIIWGVYATWNTRSNDGATYRYDEGSVITTTRSHASGPASDLVLSWTDSVATVRNANFDRIFAGPIVVAGGDGFTLDVIDNIGNTAHIDTIVIDYTVPGSYWDIDGTTAGSGGATPSGTWDAATNDNWDATSDGTGAAAFWTPGDTAVFSAGSDATGSYIVTVDGTQDITGLFFKDGDVTLAAGTSPELQLSASSAVAVADGNTATIAAPFTETGGSWKLTKLAAGSLVLNGDNSGATGGTVISGGSVEYGSLLSINGSGPDDLLIESDGTLVFGSTFGAGDIPTALDRVDPASTGLIAADNFASTDFDLDAPGLTGAYFGAIGSVNYTGTLTANGTDYRLGGGGGTLTLPSALTTGHSLTTRAPGTTQLNGFDSTVGSLSGDGDLENGSGSTSITLTVNQSSNTTFSGSINDGGAASTKLVKSGSGDLALRGSSDFTGGVEIAGGRITVTDAGNEQSFLGDASNVVTFTANGELYNSNNAVTLPQGITINGGVTGRVTGAFGERTEVNGVLAGSGTLVVQGYSAGYNAEFRNTGNTFTGPLEIRSGDSVIAEFRSLPDSPGATTIGLQSNGNLGGQFHYMSGATAPQVFNNRQFELIGDGNSGTNSGRQAKIVNSASGANTITIAQDLLITGTGTKKLYLGGGNTGDNTFAGDIPDGVAGAAFTLYKENGGKWILSGANTYTGGTEMSGGTLTVDGSLADSSMTVSSGTVEGSGTLTFGPTDQIDISGGTVDLSGFTVTGSGLTDPFYIIVDSVDGGSYTGTFATVNVPGYTVDYDYDGSGTQVALVSGAPVDPYVTWSGGEPFGGDKNGDGVSNGLAFLLGAADPDVSALDKLPVVTQSGGGLILTFDMLDSASRGTAALSVEHSSDLGISDAWTTVAVPDSNGGPTSGVTFVVSGSGTLDVTATIGSGEAAGGKLFGRLKATD